MNYRPGISGGYGFIQDMAISMCCACRLLVLFPNEGWPAAPRQSRRGSGADQTKATTARDLGELESLRYKPEAGKLIHRQNVYSTNMVKVDK